jgi:hypothetical protein
MVMATGDAVTAGEITTASNTTDLVAEQRFDNFRPIDFSGTVIFRVGPAANSVETPLVKLDGIQGLGLWGGTGMIGLGGQGTGPGASGVGVLGVGGQSEPFPENVAQGGVGVQGIAGGVADGVVGTSSAPGKSGVFGFNSLDSQRPEDAGYGVFGRCDTPNGAGVGAESALGVGARAHSGGNDGVVGLSDAANKSGVFGFNSLEGGVGYGLFGRCDADEGAGVGAESSLGVGVRGHSRYNDAVVGLSDAKAKSGVYGFNSSASGVAFGVYGRSNSPAGVGVGGSSDHGYGASFRGGLAPLRIEPASTVGAPTAGSHLTGELFVDSLGDLYFCKTGGNGPAAKWFKIA